MAFEEPRPARSGGYWGRSGGSLNGDSCWGDQIWCKFLWYLAGWWFEIFFHFHPYWGKITQLINIFQMGWNHQLVGIMVQYLEDHPMTFKWLISMVSLRALTGATWDPFQMAVFMAYKWGLPTTYKSWDDDPPSIGGGSELIQVLLWMFAAKFLGVGNISRQPGRDDWSWELTAIPSQTALFPRWRHLSFSYTIRVSKIRCQPPKK